MAPEEAWALAWGPGSEPVLAPVLARASASGLAPMLAAASAAELALAWSREAAAPWAEASLPACRPEAAWRPQAAWRPA